VEKWGLAPNHPVRRGKAAARKVPVPFFHNAEFHDAKSTEKRPRPVFPGLQRDGDYNYPATEAGSEKLSLNKYCPRLRKHTEQRKKKK